MSGKFIAAAFCLCNIMTVAHSENVSLDSIRVVTKLVKVSLPAEEKQSCSWNGGPCNSLPDCCTGICDSQLHVCLQSGN